MVADMDLMDAARLFDGVPFKHQGRTRHGIDCAGLVVLAMQEMGLTVDDIKGYGRQPDGKTLKAQLDRQLARVSRSPLPGDVLLMCFQNYPQHLAIRTDRGIIHAYEFAGRVVEHVYSQKWQDRTVGVYTLG